MPGHKPKLLVFDLDYTLWPFWVDTLVPPFKKIKQNIIDSHDQIIKFYSDVPHIIKELSNKKYQLGIASRTSEIQGAKQLLHLSELHPYFNFIEIYPGCKVTHFAKIKQNSGIDYKDMIFFDDEQRNITDINKLGVTAILVENGVTHKVIEDALDSFQC